MANATGNIALWTEPGMKGQLQTLLKFSTIGANTRMATWQKQRDQIMAWVAEHVSELQEIPAGVEVLRRYCSRLSFLPLMSRGHWRLVPGLLGLERGRPGR